MEADRLVFKRGNTTFVSLSDDRAVVQIAPFNGGDPNGAGCIMLKGKASNIRIKTDKKVNIGFSMDVMETGTGHFQRVHRSVRGIHIGGKRIGQRIAFHDYATGIK